MRPLGWKLDTQVPLATRQLVLEFSLFSRKVLKGRVLRSEVPSGVLSSSSETKNGCIVSPYPYMSAGSCLLPSLPSGSLPMKAYALSTLVMTALFRYPFAVLVLR